MSPPNSVYDAFIATASRHGDRDFLHVPASALPAGRQPITMTYLQAMADIAVVRDRFANAGYGGGHRGNQRIALALDSRPDALLHYLALNALGVSVVPLNPDYRANERAYVVNHSDATLVVALTEHVDTLRASLSIPVIAVGDPVPPASLPAAAASPRRASEAALLYTSGTTGTPKGCVLSNQYALTAGEYYNAEGGLCTVRPGLERRITPLPLFHMNALLVSTTAMILAGGCVVQLDRFHPKSWWRDVRSSRATIAHYLGVMPAMLLGLAPSADDRNHAIRFGFGANANPKDHARFEARFGFPLVEAWAMTETGAGAWLTASSEPRHVGTRCIGVPGAHLDWRLVDEADRDVANGEPGELLVRRSGPDPRDGFFSGYLKDPDATELAWRDGWFHTGDAMRVGPDGHFHFVDRRKNIIRRSGENIAALEVEAAIADHPAIRQVAVIAAPDALRDEEVMACVVASADALKTRAIAEAIQDQAFERLAYFKAPGYIAFVETLPTTATNKVQKIKLADFGADPLNAPHCFDLRDRKKRGKV